MNPGSVKREKGYPKGSETDPGSVNSAKCEKKDDEKGK